MVIIDAFFGHKKKIEADSASIFAYFKFPGTDFESRPEFAASCGETAGFNIRMFINSFQ